MDTQFKLVRVTNISQQRIDLQVQEPSTDFYMGQKQVRLLPGKSVDLPADHLMTAQVENYKSRNQIRVSSVS